MEIIGVRLKQTDGLIVFSPDAVNKGLYADILQYLLKEHGFAVKRLKYLRLGADKLEQLYGKQLGRMYPHYWIVQKLFSLGPSIAVLVERKRQVNGTTDITSDYLTMLKGSVDPAGCRSSQLRGFFAAENRLINLLHTPDNHETFLEEVLIFFSEKELAKATEAGKEAKTTEIDCSYLSMITRNKQPEGFFEVLSNVKRRVAYLLLQEEYREGLNTLFLPEYQYLKNYSQRAVVTKELHDLLVQQKKDLAQCPIQHTPMGGSNHSFTFGSNVMSATAALKTLEIVSRKEFLDNVQNVGHYIMTRLQQLQEKYPVIGDVRGIGLMIGMEIIDEEGRPDNKRARQIKEVALQNNLLVRLSRNDRGNVVKIRPALIITLTDAEELCDCLAKIFADIFGVR